MKFINEGYNDAVIYKLIWYHSLNPQDYEKFIYVGQRSSNIVKILTKLQKGYQALTKKDEQELEKEINYFKKIFGEIIPYKTYFIYDYIEDSITIKNLQEKIYNTLPDNKNLMPNHQYLWAKVNNISNLYLINICNSFFENEAYITKETFIEKLENLLMMTKKEITNYIKELFPAIYKGKNEINLFKPEIIYYKDIIMNDEFKVLIQSIEISITSKKKKIIDNLETLVVEYNNPINAYVDEYSFSKNYISLPYEDSLLTSNINLNDNLIFMITYNETKNQFNKEMLRFYFNDSTLNTKINKESIIQDYRLNNTYNLLNHEYSKFNIKDIKSYFNFNHTANNIRNIIFQVNNKNIKMKINLDYLFNNIKTSQFIPVIKLINPYELENSYVKLNISSLKNMSYESHKFVNESDILSGLNIITKFILFKIKINDSSNINVYFYDTGYLLVSIKFTNYQSVAKIKNIIKIINTVIKNINKLRTKTFKLIEQSFIFGKTLTDISSSSLKNCDYLISIKYENKLLKLLSSYLDSQPKSITIEKFIFNKFIDYINYFNKYISIISKPIEPDINIIYKGIDGFYSNNNKKSFIVNYLKNNKERLTKKNVPKIAKYLEKIFLSNYQDNLQFVNSLDNSDLLENEAYNAILALVIKINISDSKMTFSFDNIDNFLEIRKIMFYFKFILGKIVDDLLLSNKSNQFQLLEYSNPKEEITKKKSTKSENVNDFDFIVDDLQSGNTIYDDYLDIDYNEIDNLVNLEDENQGQPETPKEEEEEEDKEEKENIYINIQKKDAKKLTLTTYMKKMREKFDPELFKNDKKYSEKCPAQQMRQPFIVSYNDLIKFNPAAFTGYMKYRNNYYICPRLWDYKANKPVSVEDYIKNGRKSPYTNGSHISIGKKQELDNQHTIIIRKPDTDLYWSKPEKEVDFPPELKNSGGDAFPGLQVIKGSSNNLCRPCCFKNVPLDWSKSSSNKLTEIKKFKNYGKCISKSSNIKQKIGKNEESASDNYIRSDTTILTNNKLGLLPKELNLLLNNHQSIFINKDKNNLINYANCFLRRGVNMTKVGNFLNCMAYIFNINNIAIFKQLLVDNISVELFMSLNNGDLIKIYSSNSIFPNNNKEMISFKNFLNNKPSICRLLNLNIEYIDNYDTYILNAENTVFTKKIIILYKIYSAYTNYIKKILNDDTKNDYTHYLDLFSNPIPNISNSDINIIIFNKQTNKILCNPYLLTSNSKKYILLIKENYNNFTPVYHIKYINNSLKYNGVIPLDKTINLSEKEIKVISNKQKNKNIINSLKKRSQYIINLHYLHNTYCSIKSSIPLNNYDIEVLFNELLEYKILAQIVTNTPKVQYLLTQNNLLIPINPISISLDYSIKLLSEVNLRSDLEELWLQYTYFNQAIKFNYKPKFIIINNENTSLEKEAIGIQFENGFHVPIKKTKIPKSMSTIPTIKKNIYTDFDNINIREQIQIKQILYEDYLYQQFKFEFSTLIKENINKKYKESIESLFYKAQNYKNYSNDLLQFKLQNTIIDIMKFSISKKKKNIKPITPGFNISIAYKSKKNKCINNPFLQYDESDNICYLNMDKENLELFSYLLTQDLINSEKERINILNGSYFPFFYLDKKIFKNLDEIIVPINKTTQEINKIIISKYYKNLPLTEFDEELKTYNLNKKDIQLLKEKIENKQYNFFDTLTSKLINKTLDFILPSNIIISTPFNADGVLNKNFKAKPCIFPFIDKKTYKLNYNCKLNKDKLMSCPIALNENKLPTAWSYCPEDPLITNKKNNILKIQALGDKKEGYYDGECLFPYLENNKLKYTCTNDTTENEDGKKLDFSWCPVKFKRGNVLENPVPIAAKSINDIWDYKWKYREMFNLKTNSLHESYLVPSKKGYCQPPSTFMKKTKGTDLEEITIETYVPNYCLNTPSKKGYNKFQLYNFGVDKLNINNKLLKNNQGVIYSKDILCKIINSNFLKITKNKIESIQDFDNLKCSINEKKGGYSKNDLRFFLQNVLNFKDINIFSYSKSQLCSIIESILKKNKEYSYDYPGNILLCQNTPHRGGISKKNLNKVAVDNFGIDINNKSKNKLCKEIKTIINKKAKLKKNNKKTKKKLSYL